MNSDEKIKEYREILESLRQALNEMTPRIKNFSSADIKAYGDLYRDVAELTGKLNCLEALSCKIA